MSDTKHFATMLKDLYSTSELSPQDFAKYWLIEKYKHKVSPRLLQEQKVLLEKGKKLFGKAFRELAIRSPFWQWFPNATDLVGGKYTPVPIPKP